MIKLPHNYFPRSYQYEFFKAMDVESYKRACLVWHRRAGKDLTVLNWCITQTQKRVGTYYEIFPTYNQGRKILWDGITGGGTKFIDHFPKELIKRKSEVDMRIELTNGSAWQIVGADNLDRIVGTNPIGCIYSEWALMNPKAKTLTDPMLLENDGWGVYVYTPRGKNHGYKLAMMADKDPIWYYSHLTIEQTRRDSPVENGGPIYTPQMIEQLRREGLTTEDMIQQEYYCSWAGEQDMFFWGKEMNDAEKEGRICDLPWHPELPVMTAWDIGMHDGTAIWFVQKVGEYYHFIDYYEDEGKGLQHYVKFLQDKPYVYPTVHGHIAPHDMAVREWGSDGKTRFQIAQGLGVHYFIVPKLPLGDGIDAVRRTLPLAKFDKFKCANGISALQSYSKEWDDKKSCFKKKPVHDWCSHGADAVRMFALGVRNPVAAHNLQTQAFTDFDPLSSLDPRRPQSDRGRQTHYNTEWNPFEH
jgi:hypothetical protein